MRNEDVFEYHRSALSLFFSFLLVIVPITLIYIIFTSQLVARIGTANALWRCGLVYRLCCLIAALEMVRRYFNELYVFGRNRIIHFDGRIDLRLSRLAIAYKDVRNVGVHQGILGRIFDYGTLTIATASMDDIEIIMTDIPNPRKVATFVLQHMEELKKSCPDLELPVPEQPTALPMS